MTLHVGTTARNAACNAVTAAIDAGTAGTLRIYTGSAPANPQTTATGTLLAAVVLNKPSFGTASVGVATIVTSPTLTATAGNTGTAGWFRIVTSTEAAGTGLGTLDGSVTATGGGGDLTLDSVSITSGLAVNVTGGTVTQPG